VETSGCVLVRPDQHVAWRAQRFGAESPAELTTAVRQAIGWPA
jgi:2,4-dichlorophenol 6-monooxygenase